MDEKEPLPDIGSPSLEEVDKLPEGALRQALERFLGSEEDPAPEVLASFSASI